MTQKAGLTRSDVGDVGADGEGASVASDWLQEGGAGSEAVGEAGCTEGETVSFGSGGSVFSSSSTVGETLNKKNVKGE